jgi:uncharacterized protein (DUF433 family)
VNKKDSWRRSGGIQVAGQTKQTKIISRDPEIMNGELVFAGTRVEVKTLVDYLKSGHPISEFLDDFPTVRREQAEGYLQISLEAVGAVSAAHGQA